MNRKTTTLVVCLVIVFFIITTIIAKATLLGDLDGDGDVDIDDYTTLISFFDSLESLADLNGNGKVDIFDFNLLVSNFGKSDLAEVVQPATRDPSQWEEARCNDGTPFAFEIRESPVQSKNWVVYLEGGGFCDDQANFCEPRIGEHTTTITDPTTGEPYPDRSGKTFAKNAGIFNAASLENPTFHDANWVFAKYCSSDVWAGNTPNLIPIRPFNLPQQSWYFSGKLNVKAMFEVLKEQYGLNDTSTATKVLFIGESAGGGGVVANAEDIKNLLPGIASRGNLKLVTDGGAISDYDNENYRPGDATVPVRELVKDAYFFHQSKLNSQCEALFSADNRGLCFLLKNSYPTIVNNPPQGLGLPLLISTSTIDEYALKLHHILDDNGNPIAPPEVIEDWRAVTLDELEPPPPAVGWLFSNGDHPYHTISTNDDFDDGWNMSPPGEPQNSYKNLLTRFWNGEPEEHLVFGNPGNGSGASIPLSMAFFTESPLGKVCNYPIISIQAKYLKSGPDENPQFDPRILDEAQGCGTKIRLNMHTRTDKIVADAGGLDITKWTTEVSFFRDKIEPYIYHPVNNPSGPVFIHRVIDEPQDNHDWIPPSCADISECPGTWGPTAEQVDEVAALSKQWWPDIETELNTIPSWITGQNHQFAELDVVNFQFAFHKYLNRGGLSGFVNDAVAAHEHTPAYFPKRSWGIQAYSGGSSVYQCAAMTPEQIRAVSETMCRTEDSEWINFNSYVTDFISQPEIAAALDYMTSVCANGGPFPSPAPDPSPLPPC